MPGTPRPEHSVKAFRNDRLPFDWHPPCPACRGLERHVAFATERRLRGLDDEKMLAGSMGGDRDPHLIITCSVCGFWWEQEVAAP